MYSIQSWLVFCQAITSIAVTESLLKNSYLTQEIIDNEKFKKVRYAIIGLGHISQVSVLPAFKAVKNNSEIVAFV